MFEQFVSVNRIHLIQQEEQMLVRVYGGHYRDYCDRVPRFLPRLSQWRGAGKIDLHVDRIVRTFIDACVFLLAIPVAEFLAYLQSAGLSPVLLRIP